MDLNTDRYTDIKNLLNHVLSWVYAEEEVHRDCLCPEKITLITLMIHSQILTNMYVSYTQAGHYESRSELASEPQLVHLIELISCWVAHSYTEKDILYVPGLSRLHYGLTGLYVIRETLLKALLSRQRRNHWRKGHILLLIQEHRDKIGWLMPLWECAKLGGKTQC